MTIELKKWICAKPLAFRRYLYLSILIHVFICALITLSILSQRNRVKHQEARFIQTVQAEQERIAEQEKTMRENAIEELLLDQTLAEVKEILEDRLEAQYEDLLVQSIEDRLRELLESTAPPRTAEELESLSQLLRKEAFEGLLVDVEQLKRDLLIEQVQVYIRTKVAPAIKSRFDDQLKTDLGARIKQNVINQAGIAEQNQPDGFAREVASLATPGLEAEVREQVKQKMTAVVIPMAAERMMKALNKELKKRDLNAELFREFIEHDISVALEAALTDYHPDAGLALLSTKRHYEMDELTLFKTATDPLAKMAEKLNKLADVQKTFRDEVPEDEPWRDALKQETLAGEIRDTRAEALRLVEAASKQSIQTGQQISDARRQLTGTAIEKNATAAGKALERKVVSDAKKMMDLVTANLRTSAKTLETLHLELTREIAALQGPKPILPTGASQKNLASSAEQVVEKTGTMIEPQMKRIAINATYSVDTGSMFEDETALDDVMELSALEVELAQTAKNKEVGRPTDGGMDILGVGQGILPLGSSSGEYLPWDRPGGRTISAINLRAYKEFVKDMRGRLDPDNYYSEVEVHTDWDVPANTAPENSPSVIFIDSLPPTNPAKEPLRREVPQPAFKTHAFGAAAMMETPPEIDGDLSDWGELRHGLPLLYTGSSLTPVETGPTVYVRWSPDGLYFGYTIDDPNGIQPCPKESWDGDCLEVMIDTANSRRPVIYLNPDAQKFQLTPFGCRGDASLTLWEMGRGLLGLIMQYSYSDPDGVKGRSAARQHDGSYTFEGFISRRALARPVLVPGKYVGLNFSLNRGGKLTTYQWSATQQLQSWRHPDTWGDLMLLGSDARVHFTDSPESDEDDSGITVGETLYVKIQDADMNINTHKIDRIPAELVVKESGSSLFVVLNETGVNTGIFRASVHTQAYFMEPKEYTLNIRNGDTLQLIYTDARSEYGEKNHHVTAEMPIGWPVFRLGSTP